MTGRISGYPAALFFVGWAFFAQAFPMPIEEGYVVRRWGVEDGLPEGIITSVAQFPDGFMWLTTPRHLVRFDGIEFVALAQEEYPKPKPRRLNGILRDRGGKVWVSGEDGVMRYDGRKWQNVPLDIKPIVEGTGLRVFSIREAADGKIWVASDVGMCRYDGQVLRLVPPTEGVRLGTFSDAAMAGRPGGEETGTPVVAWLLGKKGVVVFDGQDYKELAFPEEKTGTMPFLHLFAGANRALWATDRAGNLTHLTDGRREKMPPPALRISSLLDFKDGSTLIGAVEGLYRCSKGGWSLLFGVGLEMGSNVRCLAADLSGEYLWAGTGNGLVQLRTRLIEMIPATAQGQPQAVTALIPRGTNGFWAGVANRGLWTGSARSLAPFISDPPVVKNSFITALMESSDGTLWFGTRGNHVWRVQANGRVEQIPTFDGAFSRDITSLSEDLHGRHWAGSGKGLLCMEKNQLRAVEVGFDDAVLTICGDGAGGLWVGTQSSGLWRRSDKGVWSDCGRADGLPSDMVRALCRDDEGRLWIATPKGLAILEDGGQRAEGGRLKAEAVAPASGIRPRIFCFTREQGLPDDDIRQMLDDGQGWLWLGTRRGIMRLGKDELADVANGMRRVLAPLLLGTGDGLEGDLTAGEYCGLLAARTADGKIVFATSAGVAMVEPLRLKRKPEQPSVYIVGMEAVERGGVARRGIKAQNVMGVGLAVAPIVLAAGSRDIWLRFTAPCFSVPEQVLFRTKLDGYDSDWSKPMSERELVYPKLPPGSYRFRVMASSPTGGWQEAANGVRIIMRSFYWQTWWFRTFVGGVIVLLLFGVALSLQRRRYNARMRLLEQQHALEHERTRIASDIHDQVGASLTKISKLTEFMDDQAAVAAEHRPALLAVADTTREIVQAMDGIVWAINPRNDTLDNLANYLVHYVQEFLKHGDTAYELDVPLLFPALPVQADVRHNLFLAVKEALNNAVKHGAPSRIRLQMAVNGNELIVTVEDNGTGFNRAAVSPGRNGLENMRKRMESVGGKIELDSALGRGTRICFAVPLRGR